MKKLTFLFALLCASVLGFAKEVNIANTFSSETGEEISSYEKNWENTSGTTLIMQNFNNNKWNQWNYVKCGRKNVASVATITTKEALTQKITKVEVVISGATVSKVNSFYLEVAKTNEFDANSEGYEKITKTLAVGKDTFAISSPAESMFYRITFDCDSHTANGIVTVNEVNFIYEEAETPGSEEPTVEKWCEKATGHEKNAEFGDPNGRILLSIAKVEDTNNLKVTVKNNSEAGNTKTGLNFLWVNATGATNNNATYGSHATEDSEEVSVVVEFAEAQETYNFANIHWSYSGWEGEWAIDALEVKAEELCVVETPEEPATYTLTLPEGVTADKELTGLKENDVVQLTVTVPEGKELESLKANDVELTVNENNVATLTIATEDVVVTVSFKDAQGPEEPGPGEGEDDSESVAVSVVFSEKGYDNGAVIDKVELDNVITLTFSKGEGTNDPKYYNTGTSARIYGGGTLTVTAIAGYVIEKIELTFGSGDGTNEITTNAVTYADGVWTGSANEVVFTVGGTTGHRRIEGVKVTYKALNEAVINASAVAFGNAYLLSGNGIQGSKEVAVGASNITEDIVATITDASKDGVFTLSAASVSKDGGNLTVSYTVTEGGEYSAKLNLKSGDVEVSYDITLSVVAPIQIKDVLAMIPESGNSDEFMLKEVVVTYHNGSNTYVKDETGYFLIYDKDFAPAAGTVVRNLIAKATLFNDLPETANGTVKTDMVKTEEGEAAEPDELTGMPTKDDINRYVILRGIKFNDSYTLDANNRNATALVGGSELAVYNTFKIEDAVEDDTEYDVVAIVSINKGNLQISPITITKAGSPSGIEAIKAQQLNGKMFNLQGQQVDATYKGIVILNGKKMVLR